MIILTQNRQCVINADYVKKVYTRSGNQIQIETSDGRGEVAGGYNKPEQAERALGMMFGAWSNDEPLFEFPSPADLPDLARLQGSHIKTKSNRHGGS